MTRSYNLSKVNHCIFSPLIKVGDHYGNKFVTLNLFSWYLKLLQIILYFVGVKGETTYSLSVSYVSIHVKQKDMPEDKVVFVFLVICDFLFKSKIETSNI